MMKKCVLFCLVFNLVLAGLNKGFAQYDKQRTNMIQFSGVIISSDSAHPIPFVNVNIKSTQFGTISNFGGFFSLPVMPNDTLFFTSLGYKRKMYVIPANSTDKHLRKFIPMQEDTITLKTAIVRAFPRVEHFKEVFLKTVVPDDGISIAIKNLEIAEKKAKLDPVPVDGSMTYKFVSNQRADRLYYAGQFQPMLILDPFAWAKFIQAWKNGDLKIERNP